VPQKQLQQADANLAQFRQLRQNVLRDEVKSSRPRLKIKLALTPTHNRSIP
jgi:hypothetical protein